METNAAGGAQSSQRQQPRYDPTNGGHYGASAALAAQGHAPGADIYTGTWANVNQGLQGNYRDILMTYWQQIISHLENDTHDYKLHQLPLARIKKVMKADPEVKMISAEAPILFAKGCDIFITELTMRAWIHAEENKRRTLQRSDIASALAKSDMFDFLIDIVPREEAAGHAKRTTGQGTSSGATQSSANSTGVPSQANVVQQPHPPAHAQHQIGPPDFPIGANALTQDSEYRQPPNMYAPQVPPDAGNSYGQPQQQMFGDMYGYPSMAAQQMYQVGQRDPDASGNQESDTHFQRTDGEGGPDTNGERHF